MPLTELEVPINDSIVPEEVSTFLKEADLRINAYFERHHVSDPIAAFVPSDFQIVYSSLRGIADAGLATGKLFCEWGSGYGVAAALASLLDFDAVGIEIDEELFEGSRKLAEDFVLPVRFVRGDFIPPGSRAEFERLAKTSWVEQGGENGYETLGLDPTDFNVVFVYPWPGEERIMDHIFEQNADSGALLLTYHMGGTMRLQRMTD